MAMQMLVNIGSGNGLLPVGTKPLPDPVMTYRKTSSISHTKFQNLNVSCIILQLHSLNQLKPCAKLKMKM